MLMGAPLGHAQMHQAATCGLNAHLRAVADLIPRVYGDCGASHHAVLEVRSIADMNDTAERLSCKRALLLFALGTEPAAAAYWQTHGSDASRQLANDLTTRVLPFLLPRYLKNNCQAPESLLHMALVLSQMWQGEQLGSFPTNPTVASSSASPSAPR